MLASETASWASDQPWPGILAGLVMLVLGAEFLVRGAVWIALVIGMSRMTVGLTLVAIGTSLPELLVSFTAAEGGHDGLAFTNVLGSNVANTLLIVGSAAAICAIHLKTRWLELNWMLLATALLAVPFLLGSGIDRPLAAGMLGILILFLTHLLVRERRQRRGTAPQEKPPEATAGGWARNVFLLALGMLGLKFGANWLVDGAVAIAKDLGMSEELVGETIVAIGTSLPELATSAVAALRKQPEICIGNVLGSNIFNVCFVLGVAGLLKPLTLNHDALWFSLGVTGLSAVALVVILKATKGVPRAVGFVFLACYCAFLGYRVWGEIG